MAFDIIEVDPVLAVLLPIYGGEKGEALLGRIGLAELKNLTVVSVKWIQTRTDTFYTHALYAVAGRPVG
eukprot:scaffold30598_cov118-Skeletonema_dohrnii-CCMP3373.AAC.1